MKIFEKNESSWDEKVNFVDDNDVFVGYDMGQSCCEQADWFILEEITPYTYDLDDHLRAKSTPDLVDYCFDINFFKEVESSDLDAGGMVAFKLTSKNKPDLYLHLFNAHNGYYGHGFTVKHGDETVKNGDL